MDNLSLSAAASARIWKPNDGSGKTVFNSWKNNNIQYKHWFFQNLEISMILILTDAPFKVYWKNGQYIE